MPRTSKKPRSQPAMSPTRTRTPKAQRSKGNRNHPRRDPITGLNHRQEMFCRAFVAQGFQNASKAAVEAGYSALSANQISQRLLSEEPVVRFINAEKERIAKKYEVTAEHVVAEMARLGFSNMQDYMRVTSDGSAVVDLSNLTEDQAAAIQELTSEVYTEGRGEDAEEVKRTKIKLADKKSPLELLGRYVGVFKESNATPPVVNIRITYKDAPREVETTEHPVLTGKVAS